MAFGLLLGYQDLSATASRTTSGTACADAIYGADVFAVCNKQSWEFSSLR